MLGLKDNQPTLYKLAQRSLLDLADEWVSDWEKDHGRIERRRLARADLDWQISPFPSARQFVKITREWMEGKSDELKSETRYFITSLEREERSTARLAQAIRGHWSVKTKTTGNATTVFGKKTPRGRARKPAEAKSSRC